MAVLAKALRSSTYNVRAPSDLAELGKSTLDHFIEVQIYEDTHDVLRVKFRETVQAAKAAKAKIELLQQVPPNPPLSKVSFLKRHYSFSPFLAVLSSHPGNPF